MGSTCFLSAEVKMLVMLYLHGEELQVHASGHLSKGHGSMLQSRHRGGGGAAPLLPPQISEMPRSLSMSHLTSSYARPVASPACPTGTRLQIFGRTLQAFNLGAISISNPLSLWFLTCSLLTTDAVDLESTLLKQD